MGTTSIGLLQKPTPEEPIHQFSLHLDQLTMPTIKRRWPTHTAEERMEKLKVPVEEFTTPDPLTASEDTSAEDLAGLMTQHGVRHIPILKADQVIGIVSERDLKVVAGLVLKEKNQVRAGDIMARDPVTVSSMATLDEVAFEMSTRKIGSVIVNDGDKFLGIFTVTDALNALIEITRNSED
jgi:acetoin utilization protein AcuB